MRASSIFAAVAVAVAAAAVRFLAPARPAAISPSDAGRALSDKKSQDWLTRRREMTIRLCHDSGQPVPAILRKGRGA